MSASTGLSPKIIPREELTLSHLDNPESGTIVENLPSECQVLYANLAGKNICLDTPQFSDFSKAIQQSVRSEGSVAGKAMKAKGNNPCVNVGFGTAQKGKFLLKVFPPKTRSQGFADSSYTVTKFLHGRSTCQYDGKAIGLKKGDAIWAAPNQQYTIDNDDDDICVIIQARAGGNENAMSDCHFNSFSEFREAIRNEWKESKGSGTEGGAPPVPFYI